VFLTSRGNLKEVEKHLGVSYPTARSRFNDLLDRLGCWRVAATGVGAPTSGPDQEAESTHRPRAFASEPSAEARLPWATTSGTRSWRRSPPGTLAPDVAADLLARLCLKDADRPGRRSVRGIVR
jgi:hypothetical protein